VYIRNEEIIGMFSRPVEGSSTERRGKAAKASVANEMKTLCETIYDCGCAEEDKTAWITFGELFSVSLYVEFDEN
jgi:hypothetical protein